MSIILDAMRTLLSKRMEKVYKILPTVFVWHEMCSSHTLKDPYSSPSSLKSGMGMHDAMNIKLPINIVNRLSVNSWPIYTFTMRKRPNRNNSYWA